MKVDVRFFHVTEEVLAPTHSQNSRLSESPFFENSHKTEVKVLAELDGQIKLCAINL